MRREDIPETFVKLYQAGRFDYWGAPYKSLTAAQRQALIPQRECQVLWWRSIEWDESLDSIAAFEGDECLRPGLIPFGGDGSGDRYCWYPRWQTGPEIPVVFYVHDENESRLFARSFDECLVRCMLKHVVQWSESDDFDAARMRRRWDAHLAILRAALPSAVLEPLVHASADLSPEICERLDRQLAADIGKRTLIGAMQPTRYNEAAIRDRTILLKCYDRSISFYRELVEQEGLVAYDPQLREAMANRERIARG